MRIANDDSVGGDGIGGAAHDGSAGRRTGTVFYSFDLDKVVPPDYLVRQIDSLLDQSWVKEMAPYYSHTGRLNLGYLV